jgi:hypothetical protein
MIDPPKPPPEPFRKVAYTLVREDIGTAEETLWVGIPGNTRTADEMALALTECAAYIREMKKEQS